MNRLLLPWFQTMQVHLTFDPMAPCTNEHTRCKVHTSNPVLLILYF